jgi:antitoxin VapB
LGFGKTEIFLQRGLDNGMTDRMTDLPVGVDRVRESTESRHRRASLRAVTNPSDPLSSDALWHMSLALARRPPILEQRRVRLFRDGRNQAVCIPVEFELPGDEAIMHRDGNRLVIEPVRKRGLVALLKAMEPLAQDFPEIDDPVPARS